MRIVIIGAAGPVGGKTAAILRDRGHEVAAASPASDARAAAAALEGASVVIDAASAPFASDDAVPASLGVEADGLLSAERGAPHHVLHSVVGAGRLPESGYLRALRAREERIETSRIPYTIVRATQLFEALDAIADSSMREGEVRLSPAYVQPVAADDVAALLARVATGAPTNATIEIAGPERFSLDDLVRRHLRARGDPRAVSADVRARYLGAALDDRSLTPGADPEIGATTFDAWLRRALAR